MNRKRVLFTAYGGGHISMVVPVIEAIRSQHSDIDCVLLALTTGFTKARAAGLNPLGYRDFLHLVDADAAIAWGERLYGGNESPDVSRDESLAYLGINYLDLIEQLGHEGAAIAYGTRGRYAFKPLRFMQKVVDALCPDAVVATNSPRSEEAVLRIAAERGIPSVALVDLFGLDSDPFVLREVKPLHTCVIAESVRQRLVSRGFSSTNVHVTGNPGFDGLFKPEAAQQARDFLTEKRWAAKKVILYIGAKEAIAHPNSDVAPGRGFAQDVEDILRTYVQNRTHCALIVRYHPGDWFNFRRHPDNDQVHFSVPPREPIHPLVLASSVVVTANSTVGLEAAVAGKPVVSLENSPAVMHVFSLAELGIAYPSPTHLHLEQTLDRVMALGLPLTAFSSDGAAAARVGELIGRALSKPATRERLHRSRGRGL